jgi:hypothetical protein
VVAGDAQDHPHQQANRITSLADFIASRYGKSALLGGLVTVIAVIGILPYISLQLKACPTASRSCCSTRRSHARQRGAAPSLRRHGASGSR